MAVRSGIFKVAFEAPGDYYNRQTRVIALAGPRGTLLANYTMPAVRPDPVGHRFLCYYDEAYKPYNKMVGKGRDALFASVFGYVHV